MPKDGDAKFTTGPWKVLSDQVLMKCPCLCISCLKGTKNRLTEITTFWDRQITYLLEGSQLKLWLQSL